MMRQHDNKDVAEGAQLYLGTAALMCKVLVHMLLAGAVGCNDGTQVLWNREAACREPV